MLKKLLLLLAIFGLGQAFAQSCPILLEPLAGATNVPVESTIRWQEIIGVPNYLISLGTTPGGNDLLTNTSVGTNTFFTPPMGLPDNTEIFVTITLFFFSNQENNIVCPSISFTTEDFTDIPECTNLRRPFNGETNVDLRSNISWDFVPGATSYEVEATTAGGVEILPLQIFTNTLRAEIPGLLPINEEILVSITPINENGRALNCEIQSFTTASVETNLGCTFLISPQNGETNVGLSPIIEWEEVPGAEGYRVSIGTTPDTNDILLNGEFRTTRTPIIEFEANRQIFITIVPFNILGEAIECSQESFSTALGCGPFLDRTTGELVTLFPEFDFPSTFSICQESPPITISTDVVAEEYRWVRTTANGTEIELLSESQNVELSEGGFYRLEVSNFADPNGNNIPCTTGKDFVIEVLPGPTIESIETERNGNGLRLTVNVIGNSTYEYALNNINGPYQNSNIFENAPLGDNIVFVRDINEQNCIIEAEIMQDSIREGFPNFFTPNGDAINDFWQFIQPPNAEEVPLETISIFDRFGKLLAQIDPDSAGWDGTFNGRPLPSGGYWFRALINPDQQVQGFFTLKR